MIADGERVSVMKHHSAVVRLLPAINYRLTPTHVSCLSNLRSVCFRDGGAMRDEQRPRFHPEGEPCE